MKALKFKTTEQRTQLLHEAFSREEYLTDAYALKLIDAGVDLFSKDKDGCTLLWKAIWSEKPAIIKAILDHPSVAGPEKSKLLEDALFQSVHNHNHEITALLLDRGADVNTRVVNRGTGLHYAACYGSGELAEVFLRHRVKLGIRDYNGKTALDLAITNQSYAVRVQIEDAMAEEILRKERVFKNGVALEKKVRPLPRLTLKKRDR